MTGWWYTAHESGMVEAAMEEVAKAAVEAATTPMEVVVEAEPSSGARRHSA
jgi:uncharacterized protein YqgV (UPF0045/DUF77 family)